MYGVNKQKTFNSKKDYANYIHRKYKVDASEIIYASNNTTKSNLLMYVYKNHIGYYFGTFANDSLIYIKSEFLKENQSCYGRVEKDLKAILNQEMKIETNSFFQQNKFYYLSDNKEFSFENKTIFFAIISYKYGKVMRNEFDRVKKILAGYPDFKFVAICFDKLPSD